MRWKGSIVSTCVSPLGLEAPSRILIQTMWQAIDDETATDATSKDMDKLTVGYRELTEFIEKSIKRRKGRKINREQMQSMMSSRSKPAVCSIQFD